MGERLKVTEKKLGEVEAALREVSDPPRDSMIVQRAEALRRLAPQLRELRDRGWSPQAIAEKLTDLLGVPCSVANLQDALKRRRKGKKAESSPANEQQLEAAQSKAKIEFGEPPASPEPKGSFTRRTDPHD